VVAIDRYVAEDAVELVVVDYEPLEPVVDYRTAHETTELVHAQCPGNLAGALSGVEMGLELAGVPHRKGGVAAALEYVTESQRVAAPVAV